MLYLLNAKRINTWRAAPYALAKSNQIIGNNLHLLRASFSAAHTIDVCSQEPVIFWTEPFKNVVSIKLFLVQACRYEKMSAGVGWGAANNEILSAAMVAWQRKFFISNHLKWLENLNICWRCLLRNSLESDLKVSKFSRFFKVWSWDLSLKCF